MILVIIGLVLVIISLLAAKLSALFLVGIVIGCVGLFLLLLNHTGHPVAGTGRRWYW